MAQTHQTVILVKDNSAVSFPMKRSKVNMAYVCLGQWHDQYAHEMAKTTATFYR